MPLARRLRWKPALLRAKAVERNVRRHTARRSDKVGERMGGKTMATGLGLALALAGFAGAARAQDDEAICADRPGKAYSPCTVPKGDFQVETDLYDQSWMKTSGEKTTLTYYTNPTFKYGLTDKVDLEAAIAPWQTTRTKDRATGQASTQRGPSDLTLEFKYAITKEITVMPFVTAPTAGDGQGAGGWGGGVRAPMQFSLPGKGWSVSLTPELDAVHNQEGDGAHFAHVEVVGLNKELPRGFSTAAELWAQWDYDPSGHTTQASFDLELIYVPPGLKTLQLDAQVNFGLTDDTPDTQVILGISKRF